MPIEQILIRIMLVIGGVMLFIDVRYYSAKFTPILAMIMFSLFMGSVMLSGSSSSKAKEKPLQKKLKFLEKPVLAIIILLMVALAFTVVIAWKYAPFQNL